ncbi:FAD-dependent oxidoreductase [Tengunoibacter tsumagoiensis]|uniref:Oxygenase n=1 Tax=Tengunoibacter tsumagoiensis TaxID=2014871 RepID=A0A402A039_9CHLR|nr:FAD-dependent oxidoreductase [Tengunoibacter tsumagoiensis]GCE12474.1 oxygenase [Tengunoibacter tsumagoiensis]
MSLSQKNTDVLIVGAGPVGLSLAYELHRHGVSCRIIDQKMAPSETSRALGVFNRTLEVFERMGIAQEITAKTQPVHFLNVYARGEHLMQVSFESRAFETPFTYPVFCPQTHVEEVLRNRLATDIHVEWGVTLEAFEQDATGVTVQLRDTRGDTSELRVSWLAGCDGGHSKVRKDLHLPFTGNSSETWLIADVELDWSLAKDSVYGFFSPLGTVMAYPFPEGKRWRLLNTAAREQTDPASVAQQFTHAIASVYHEEPVHVPEPLWTSVFTIQQRHVPMMRVGHCFVLGDAAHVHSPASGQGMNTGIQDAFNLAWKLALVARNVAEESLLDSYTAERTPIATTVLRGAKGFTLAIGNPTLTMQYVRNIIMKSFFLLKPLRSVLNGQVSKVLSGLSLSYKQSQIVTEDWRVEGINTRNMGGLLSGERLPDIHYGFDNTARLYNLLHSTDHTVLLFAGLQSDETDLLRIRELAEYSAQQQKWLRPVLIAPNPESYDSLKEWSGTTTCILDQYGTLHHRFGAEKQTLYLIRPDGYIGYRNQPATPGNFESYAKHVLGIRATVLV